MPLSSPYHLGMTKLQPKVSKDIISHRGVQSQSDFRAVRNRTLKGRVRDRVLSV